MRRDDARTTPAAMPRIPLSVKPINAARAVVPSARTRSPALSIAAAAIADGGGRRNAGTASARTIASQSPITLGGAASERVAEADLLERGARGLLASFARVAAKLERERHVREEAPPRQEVRVLEHERDRAARRRDVDLATRRAIEPGDDPKERR